MATGLPPNNNMKFLIHNQKMDAQSSNEILKSIEFRLQLLEDQLADNLDTSDME